VKTSLVVGMVGIVLMTMWAMGASAQAWSAPEIVGVPVNSFTVGGTIGDNPDLCITEPITFNGDFNMELTTMVDGSGQTHVRSVVPHFNVTATRPNGEQYTLLMVTKQVETISDELIGIESTQIFRIKVNGEGALPNESIYMTVHVTNPNPNSQSSGVEVDNFTVKCNAR
jgi:hypothetical protein